MTLRIYDTMAREKRVFEPQDPSRITLYVCGPTVYNYAHIGNARPPVVFDVLRRLLKDMYGRDAVVFARNFTDVDDKIIKAHQETGEPIAAITKKYADIYLEDMSALNVLAPDLSPRATDHISDMIAIGEQLKRKGYAYVTKDGLYFQVDQMSDYGKLSGRRQEDSKPVRELLSMKASAIRLTLRSGCQGRRTGRRDLGQPMGTRSSGLAY